MARQLYTENADGTTPHVQVAASFGVQVAPLERCIGRREPTLAVAVRAISAVIRPAPQVWSHLSHSRDHPPLSALALPFPNIQ